MNPENEKSIILLRGLPGAGKSTLAILLSENGKYPIHCIDDYFTNSETGEYNFDYQKNHLAYKACLDQLEESLKKETAKILIPNTFTIEWEMELYFQLAEKYQYRVFVLTVENRHKGKNIHAISEIQLRKMAEKYKVQLLT